MTHLPGNWGFSSFLILLIVADFKKLILQPKQATQKNQWSSQYGACKIQLVGQNQRAQGDSLAAFELIKCMAAD